MNRETQRQIARLRRLSSEVLTNPEYNQVNADNCIVGLGNRMVNGRIGPVQPSDSWLFSADEVAKFSKKFGISQDAVDNIYYGHFNRINPKAKDWKIGLRFVATLNHRGMRRSASRILNYIADRKERGLTV